MNNFWTIAPTRDRCENCGRFVTDQQIAHSDELGHSVCDHCADPIYDDIDCHPNYDAKSDSVIESTPMDNYADHFEDIQNGGLQTYYYD